MATSVVEDICRLKPACECYIQFLPTELFERKQQNNVTVFNLVSK